MMTMRFRSHKPRRIVPYIATLIAVAVVAAGIFFADTIFRLVGAVITSSSAPLSEEYAKLPKSILASRLSDAERELARIRYQTALSSMLIDENERLIHELNLRENDESGVGRVVSRPPETHYDTLLVSLNGGHAVSAGDLALFEGVLLGEVARVSASMALVQLFSSPGTAIDVRVGSPSAIVVAQGLGGGSFMFDIPNDIAVEAGGAVVSATHGTRIVGVVRAVATEPDRTTKRIYAHTAAALSDIRFVHFVRPFLHNNDTPL